MRDADVLQAALAAELELGLELVRFAVDEVVGGFAERDHAHRRHRPLLRVVVDLEQAQDELVLAPARADGW